MRMNFFFKSCTIAIFAMTTLLSFNLLAQDRKNFKIRKKSTPSAVPKAKMVRTTESAPSFSFEKKKGTVNAALSTLIRTTLSTAKNTNSTRGKIQNARQLLRKNRSNATKVIIKELKTLKKDDVHGHVILLTALQKIDGNATSIKYLSKMLFSKNSKKPVHTHTSSPGKKNEKSTTADTPSLRKKIQPNILKRNKKSRSFKSKKRSSHRCGEENPEALIRQLAIATLYSFARKGSKKATSAILNSLKSPNLGIKMTAVQYYYKLQPNRITAKTKMRKHLTPKNHYLLFK